MPSRPSPTSANVAGSVAVTPKRNRAITRVRLRASAAPIATPIQESFSPSLVTNPRMLARCAPNATHKNCPIQDDPERRIGFQYKMILKTGGILRVNDHPNGECRRPEPAADGSPAGNQPGGAVRRKREKGDLRVGGTGAGAARVRDAREKDAGGGAGIPGEDDGEVAAADHPSGSTVPGDGAGAGADLPAAQICPGVYGGGRALAGEGGSGARAAERTGHAADPGTEGRGVRPPGICAADADLGGALVQSAKETGLSETGSALRSYTRRPCKCSKLGLARWRATSRCQTTA